MSQRYFIETHFRANELPQLRPTIEGPDDETHLHITLVRPFSINGDAERIKEIIVNYCRGKKPIHFVLEGKATFDGTVHYIPVGSDELQAFDSGLEALLEELVSFEPKLNAEKVLHLTVNLEVEPLARTEMAMLRLTCIRGDETGKKIWFSYDFVVQEVLNREQTRDLDRWQETQRHYYQ